MSLANRADVEAALGRELTEGEAARVDVILEQLSERFCLEARHTFTVETYIHRVKVNGHHVIPSRVPLVEVLGVVDDNENPVEFEHKRGYIHVPLTSDRFVVVTYRAGYDHTPNSVRLQVAESAKRVLSINADAVSGKTQMSLTAGPYTESATFATWAVGGQAMLSPDDIALARKLRPRNAGNVWVNVT